MWSSFQFPTLTHSVVKLISLPFSSRLGVLFDSVFFSPEHSITVVFIIQLIVLWVRAICRYTAGIIVKCIFILVASLFLSHMKYWVEGEFSEDTFIYLSHVCVHRVRLCCVGRIRSMNHSTSSRFSLPMKKHNCEFPYLENRPFHERAVLLLYPLHNMMNDL